MTILQIVLWVLVGLPAGIAVLVLAAACYGAYSLRKSIRLAAEAKCPHCGATLGREAVVKAKKKFEEQAEQTRRDNPGVKLRVVAEWSIECPTCARTSFFTPQGNEISAQSRLIESRLSGNPSSVSGDLDDDEDWEVACGGGGRSSRIQRSADPYPGW